MVIEYFNLDLNEEDLTHLTHNPNEFPSKYRFEQGLKLVSNNVHNIIQYIADAYIVSLLDKRNVFDIINEEHNNIGDFLIIINEAIHNYSDHESFLKFISAKDCKHELQKLVKISNLVLDRSYSLRVNIDHSLPQEFQRLLFQCCSTLMDICSNITLGCRSVITNVYKEPKMQYSINKLSINVREFIHTVQKKSNPLEEDEDNGLTDIQVQQLKALRKLSGHLDEIKFKDIY
jgi:hypothetical protein